MPGFCRPRRPPDHRAGQRTLANRPVGTGAPAPPRRAIRACALRASADGPRLRTRSPHRLAVRARPPRILPRPGGPACAFRRRAIRARDLRASADGPRLRTRFSASAAGSRPPAPNPPTLRRPRLRAPPPGDSRLRAAGPRKRRSCPPRIPPRFGDPACAPLRTIRACAPRTPAGGSDRACGAARPGEVDVFRSFKGSPGAGGERSFAESVHTASHEEQPPQPNRRRARPQGRPRIAPTETHCSPASGRWRSRAPQAGHWRRQAMRRSAGWCSARPHLRCWRWPCGAASRGGDSRKTAAADSSDVRRCAGSSVILADCGGA